MKMINFSRFGCVVIIALLYVGCNPKKGVKQETFILPKGGKGYYAVVYSDNFNPIEDTSDIREFHFDTTRIVLTKLKLYTNSNIELFLRKNDSGFDTLQERLYPGDPITGNTIYTSRVQTTRPVNKTKDVIIYVFYVGVPSSDPGKEEFFFNRKLDSIASVNFFNDSAAFTEGLPDQRN